MGIPNVTHLQFLVLKLLRDNRDQSGRELRECLKIEGVRKSGPAFYQMMARIEEAKLAKGWYVEKIVDGQMIRERRYKITSSGTAAHDAAIAFYTRTIPRGLNYA